MTDNLPEVIAFWYLAFMAVTGGVGVLALRNPDKYLYIHCHVIPDLKEMGVSDRTIDTLLIDNPQRFFTGA